jgi:hypothetical protein
LFDRGVSIVPVFGIYPDFDEFMILQCAIEFSHDRITESIPGDGDNWLQAMSDRPKSF